MSESIPRNISKVPFPFEGLVIVPLVAWRLFGFAQALSWVYPTSWPSLKPVIFTLGGIGSLAPFVAGVVELVAIPLGIYLLAERTDARAIRSYLSLACGFVHVCLVVLMLSAFSLFHG